MEANQPPWPTRWLMTDERIGKSLWEAIDRLPPGAGIVFRHYSLAEGQRRQLGRQVAEQARQRELVLAIAGCRHLADELGAAIVHRPDRPGKLPCSMAVHDARQAQAAREEGAVLAFVAPVFATRSHPATSALGPDQAVMLARKIQCPAIALGGMDEERFRALDAGYPGAFHGFAGIDCWLRT